MDSQKGSKRLTKTKRQHNPPPVAYNNFKGNNTTLKRSPSDASYFQQQAHAHQQQLQHQQQAGLGLGISPGTSSSHSPQLRRSPSLLTPVQEQQYPQFQSHAVSSGNYPASASSFAHLPPASVGAPFNASTVDEALHASTTAGARGHAGPRRPSPPQHSHTFNADQPARLKAPALRQSASFTALARKMDTPPSGTKSPRTNRYSDEGDAAKKRLSGGGKKKGTFSSFMSNLVSSPRRPTISTPTNPMHVTHVSIDNETGEFTVRSSAAVVPRYGSANSVLGSAKRMAAHVDKQRHHRAGAETASPGRSGRCQLLQGHRGKRRRRCSMGQNGRGAPARIRLPVQPRFHLQPTATSYEPSAESTLPAQRRRQL